MAWVERHGNSFRVRLRRAGRQVTDSVHADAATAHDRAAALNATTRAIRRQLPPGPPPTLRRWTRTWLPAHLASATTITKYESILRTHVLPTFGDRRLDAISRNDVKAFAHDLGTDLSPATVRSIVSVLGLVLREAIDEHHLFFDPTARLRLRAGHGEPRPVADPRQVRMIAARMPNPQTRMLVITAAYTGMRWGELAALDRADIHLDRAQIHINGDTGALHEVAGTRWLGPPKTPAAIRDVRLPPFLVDGLDRLLHAHPYNTVFCTETGRWPWRATFRTRTWRPACDGDPDRTWQPINTGLRFHDLRHTHRTWLDEDHIPETLISNRLGHQIPGIRGVYAHITEPMQNHLAGALQERWLNSGGHW